MKMFRHSFIVFVLAVCLGVCISGVTAMAEENLIISEGVTSKADSVTLQSLSSEKKEDVKKDIKEALEECAGYVSVSKYNLTPEEAGDLYLETVYENPQLFYVKTAWVYAWLPSTPNKAEQLVFITKDETGARKLLSYAEYIDSPQLMAERKEKIEAELHRITATIDKRMSDAEKALAVHDWFALHYAYDTPASLTGLATEAHRIDGLFIEKKAVCQGYALGYIYVLNKLGINANYVASEGMKHAWNMVEIDDAWYHVDVTWDDPVEDSLGNVSHDNFLLSDAEIAATSPDPHHDWESSKTAPHAYADAFWKDVRGGMFYDDGTWYFVKGDSIVSHTGTNDTTLLTYSAGWPADGGYWPTEYCMQIGLVGDQIFYNTPTQIRGFQISNSENTFLVAEPEIGSEYIYGIMIDDNMLYYGLATDPNETVEAEKEGILLSFGFSVVKVGQDIEITTFGFSTGNLYVAAYKGNELLSLDVLSIDGAKTKYTSSLEEICGAEKVRVFAFNGVLPKDSAATIRLAS